MEMVLVVVVIMIIAIAASRIWFREQVNKKTAEKFGNSIYTSIELVRNNALLGRWIGSGTTITHPDKWIVHISTEETEGFSGSISSTTYLSWSSPEHSAYTDFFVEFPNTLAKITNLTCLAHITDQTGSWATNIDLEFIWNSLTLSGCTSPRNKALKIETRFGDFIYDISISSVTGLMEIHPRLWS